MHRINSSARELNMTLQKDLGNWDGRSADNIKSIYKKYKAKTNFLEKLLASLDDENCQEGASWIIKAWLSDGNELDKKQIKRIYSLLAKYPRWLTKLHILQSIPYMPIAKSDKAKVEKFVRATLEDDNKFVRTWAYNGFYELACQYPEYQKEAQLFLIWR